MERGIKNQEKRERKNEKKHKICSISLKSASTPASNERKRKQRTKKEQTKTRYRKSEYPIDTIYRYI